MNFEPKNFFVGLMDFFSVLLPGSMVAFHLGQRLNEMRCSLNHFLLEVIDLKGTEGWVVFLSFSYLLGQFMFLIGSTLDGFVYEPIRNGTDQRQSAFAKKWKNLTSFQRVALRYLSPIQKWLARRLIKEISDKAEIAVSTLRKEYLGHLKNQDSIKNYQWCKARLSLEYPVAISEVQRFEAHSKFFRALVFPLFLLMMYQFVSFEWWAGIIFALLLLLALMAYITQRIKSVNLAYWYIITLEGKWKTPPSSTGKK